MLGDPHYGRPPDPGCKNRRKYFNPEKIAFKKTMKQVLNFQVNFVSVLRIRIYYYADPDPGSKKCPYGSGS